MEEEQVEAGTDRDQPVINAARWLGQAWKWLPPVVVVQWWDCDRKAQDATVAKSAILPVSGRVWLAGLPRPADGLQRLLKARMRVHERSAWAHCGGNGSLRCT